MIIKFLDNIYCQVLPKEDLQKIKSCLEYPSEYWRKGPFKMVKTTSTAFLCDQRSGVLLAGLVPRVVKYCQDNGIAFDVQPLPGSLKAVSPSLPGIELREDQVCLLQCVADHKRGLLVAPPGIGKTVLAGALISQYPKSIIVMIINKTSLFTQTIENFEKWFGEKNVGIIGNGIYNPKRVNVVMAATALSICIRDSEKGYQNKNYKDFFELLTKADVLIADEAHHVSQIDGSYACIFKRCLATIRVGLTATPLIKNKEALICEGFLGEVIGELTMKEGLEKGLLARPKIKLIPVPFNSSIGDLRSYQDIYKHGIILNRARNRLVVKEAAERVAEGKSVLIIIVDVINEQGKVIQEMGRDVYGINIDIVQGSTESETREKIKKSLQKKETKVVVSTSVFKEGINIPSLDCIINACGGKSEISVLQTAGRGLRISEGKEQILIIDFLDPYRWLAQHAISRIKTYVENGFM